MVLIIGCPNCGTTFNRAKHAVALQGSTSIFACPNCGQKGRVRDQRPHRHRLRDHWCSQCGKYYQAYRGTSACPHCGTRQTHR